MPAEPFVRVDLDNYSVEWTALTSAPGIGEAAQSLIAPRAIVLATSRGIELVSQSGKDWSAGRAARLTGVGVPVLAGARAATAATVAATTTSEATRRRLRVTRPGRA